MENGNKKNLTYGLLGMVSGALVFVVYSLLVFVLGLSVRMSLFISLVLGDLFFGCFMLRLCGLEIDSA